MPRIKKLFPGGPTTARAIFDDGTEAEVPRADAARMLAEQNMAGAYPVAGMAPQGAPTAPTAPAPEMMAPRPPVPESPTPLAPSDPYEQQAGVLEDRASYQDSAADELAQHERDRSAKLAKLTQDQDAWATKYADATIDPSRWMKKNPFQAAVAGLGTLVMGILQQQANNATLAAEHARALQDAIQGKSRGPLPPMPRLFESGLKTINDAINRDIEDQKQQIGRLGARAKQAGLLLAQAQEAAGDERQAEMLVRKQYLDAFATKAEAMAARAQGEQQRAAAQLAGDRLKLEAVKVARDIDATNERLLLQRQGMESEERQTKAKLGLGYAELKQRRIEHDDRMASAELEAATRASGAGGGGKSDGMLYDPVTGAELGPAPPNRVVEAKVVKKLESSANVDRTLRKMLKLQQDLPYVERKLPSQLSAKLTEYDQMAADVFVNIKEANNFGAALSPGELEVLKKQLGDPRGVQARAAMESLRRRNRDNTQTTLRGVGINRPLNWNGGATGSWDEPSSQAPKSFRPDR